MLTALNVYSSQSSSPELPLSSFGIGSDPLHVRNITGFGPVNADINTTPNSAYRGDHYVSSFVSKRNIVLTIGLNPDWDDQTISSLRKLVYAYFMPQLEVRLEIESTDYPKVMTVGKVESVDPNIFSRDPEVQVSIICPDPDFIAVAPTTVTGTVGDGSDPSEIDYAGTVSTGVSIRVVSGGGVPAYEDQPLWFHIYTPLTSATLKLSSVVINESQSLRVDTTPGEKRVEAFSTLGGIGASKLSKVQSGSQWPQLSPGINTFAAIAYGSPDVGQPWSMLYYARFGGL